MEDIIIKHLIGDVPISIIEGKLSYYSSFYGTATTQALIDKIKEQNEEIKVLKEAFEAGNKSIQTQAAIIESQKKYIDAFKEAEGWVNALNWQDLPDSGAAGEQWAEGPDDFDKRDAEDDYTP